MKTNPAPCFNICLFLCFFFTSFSFKHTPISITLMDRTHQNALISRSYRWHCHRSAVLPCHGTTKREAGVQNEPLLSEMFCCFSYQKEQVSKLGAVWKCRVFFFFSFLNSSPILEFPVHLLVFESGADVLRSTWSIDLTATGNWLALYLSTELLPLT